MIDLLVVSYFLLVINDNLFWSNSRTLLISFLHTKRNEKGAMKIHKAQTRKNRLLLSYIKDYAVYEKEFRFFYKIWIIFLITLIPQYVSVIIANILSVKVAIIMIWIIAFIKFTISLIIFRSHIDSNRIAIYDRRSNKNNNKK